MIAFYRKELRLGFSSLSTYILFTVLLLSFGVLSTIFNLLLGYSSLSYPLGYMTLFLALTLPFFPFFSAKREDKGSTSSLLRSLPISACDPMGPCYLLLQCETDETAGGFYLRIPGGDAYPVHAPYAAAVDLEMSIEYCSLGVAAAAVALFLLSRKFTADGAFYRRVVLPVSEASFGAYLIHILILVPVSSALKGTMPMPLCVFAVAAVTFVASAIASCAVRRIPVAGKWIMG